MWRANIDGRSISCDYGCATTHSARLRVRLIALWAARHIHGHDLSAAAFRDHRAVMGRRFQVGRVRSLSVTDFLVVSGITGERVRMLSAWDDLTERPKALTCTTS